MKKHFQLVLDWLVYTNVWHSMGLASVSYMSMVFLHLPIVVTPLVSSFAIFFVLYNVNRTTDSSEDAKNYPRRAAFSRKYGKALFYTSTLFGLVLLTFYVFKEVHSLSLLIFILALGLAYSIPLFPTFKGSSFRLKDILLIKNVTVALSLTLGTTFLATSYYSAPLTFNSLLLGIFIFTTVLINTIIFDLRDVSGDMGSHITTIPAFLGTKKTKQLLYLLNTWLFLSMSCFLILEQTPKFLYFVNLNCLYAYFFIYAFGKPWMDTNFLCDIIVDGEYILIGILTFAGTLVFS